MLLCFVLLLAMSGVRLETCTQVQILENLRQNGVMDMANEFKTNGFKHVCKPPYRHTQTHVHA